MVKIQDDCVDCATGTYPCLGKTCPYECNTLLL